MDGQELRNLQEAYLEVYNEGKVAWHDPKNPNPSGYTPKEKTEAKRKQLGVDNPDVASFEKGGPGEEEYARYGNLATAQEKMSKRGKQPKGKPHHFKKNPFWKMTKGQVKRTLFGTDVPKEKKSSYPSSVPTIKEQVDIYDIILSHLLDEGYAETPEAAEAMMVNMSEEWRDSIMEGYKRYPSKRVGKKLDRMYNDPDTDTRFGETGKRYGKMMDVDSHMKGEVHPLRRTYSPKKSKAKEAENRARGK